MAIRVVATGSVAESPVQLLGEDVCAAFVLDPFPDSPGAPLAHTCEVLCRGQDLPPRLSGASIGAIGWK
jgi:hypothetical protein